MAVPILSQVKVEGKSVNASSSSSPSLTNSANNNNTNVQKQDTVLSLAENGNYEQLQSMLEQNPYLIYYSSSADDILPIHLAASGNHVAVAKLLVDTCSSLQLRQQQSQQEQQPAVVMTVEQMLNSKRGEMKATPLHWACRNGHAQMASFLIRMGANSVVSDRQLITPLHVAAQGGHVLVTALLLAHSHMPTSESATSGDSGDFKSIVVDGVDAFNFTPFMWVVYKNTDLMVLQNMAHLFLRYGSDINARDKEGRSSLDWALLNKYPEQVIDFLVQIGCHSYEVTAHGYGSAEDVKAKQFKKERNARLSLAILPIFSMSLFFILISHVRWFIATPIFFLVSSCSHALVMNYVLSSDMRRDHHFMHKSPYFGSFVQFSLVCVSIAWLFRILPYSGSDYGFGWHFLQFCMFLSIFLSFYYYYKTCFNDPGFIPMHSDPEQERTTVLSLAREGLLDDQHFCRTCFIRKPMRSKHDKLSKRCIARFDHYCPWMMNAIGFGNHVYFVAFLIAMCVGGAVFLVNVSIYLDNISDSDQKSFEGCIWPSSLCSHFEADSFSTSLAFWVFLMEFWAVIVLVTQLGYIGSGLTTNEHINYWKYQYLHLTTSEESNPFDLGCLKNCVAFWFHQKGGWRNVDYRTLHDIPVPAYKKKNSMLLRNL